MPSVLAILAYPAFWAWDSETFWHFVARINDLGWFGWPILIASVGIDLLTCILLPKLWRLYRRSRTKD